MYCLTTSSTAIREGESCLVLGEGRVYAAGVVEVPLLLIEWDY